MNSFFIGLGGAGCSAVAEFAQKIRNHGSNQNNEFLYLDTDGGICDAYPFLKNNDDFHDLGGSIRQRGHSIQNIITNAIEIATSPDKSEVQKRKFIRFLQWYDQSIESKEELTKGAEGIRMMSRAMLFANYTDIQRKITRKMTYRDENDGQLKTRKIYVVSGTCGGTGSGCVIDILYMLNKIRGNQDERATELPINLLLVMPQVYINGIPDNSPLFASYRTNAYAIVDEINALLKNYYGYFNPGTDEQHDAHGNTTYTISNQRAGMKMGEISCTDDGRPLQFTVFQNAFLFDSVTHQGYPMSHKQRSENVANFLFAIEVGTQASATLDTNISNHVRTAKYHSADASFINAFAASGMYVAQSWEELTRKFVRDKFLFQILRYGFVGSDSDVSAAVLAADNKSFGGALDSIMSTYKSDPASGIKVCLTKVLASYGYDGLGTVMENIKTAVITMGKRPSVDKVFADSNSHNEVKELARAVEQLLKSVKEKTYSTCEQWIEKYNLSHALKLAQRIDAAYDEEYKRLIPQITDYTIERYSFRRDEKRRADCAKLFEEYVKYLVYRNLSNEDDGYLDDCKKCIEKAIKAIAFKEHRMDGLKVDEWEVNFIKYLNSLKNDSTRSIWPSLDELYDSGNACLVKDNSLETDYARLVAQTGDGPDLTYNLNEAHLLYTYKKKCIDEIEKSDHQWHDLFDISKGSDVFASNVKVAFERFEKEAKKTGDEISNDSTLKKPFASIRFNEDDQTKLANTIEAFNHVSLATQYQMQDQQNVSIYVGDFNQLAWLNAKLFPQGYDEMIKSKAQDDQTTDRIFKLYVEFGHPFDDYRYFKDVYKPFFETFYKENKNKARHHQPFIDKRFFNSGGTLEYFKSAEQDQETKDLNTWLTGHKETFLKFCAWFLYRTLKSHEREGLLSQKSLTSTKFYKLVKSRNQKQIIFGMTPDFDNWKARKAYEPSTEQYKIDMGKTYRDSEIKTFYPCFELWNRILQDPAMIAVLDEDKLYEAFESAREELYDSARSQFLGEMAEKYVYTDSTGRTIVKWEQLFKDFLTISAKKK